MDDEQIIFIFVFIFLGRDDDGQGECEARAESDATKDDGTVLHETVHKSATRARRGKLHRTDPV